MLAEICVFYILSLIFHIKVKKYVLVYVDCLKQLIQYMKIVLEQKKNTRK